MTKQEQPAHPPLTDMPIGFLPVRVYYEDTDAGGIVYYANYLRFAERARTELLRTQGLNHQQMLRDYNLLFAVKLANVVYESPAKLDDLLIIETKTTKIGGASLDMEQAIRHEEGRLVATVNVKLVAISPTGQVTRLPPPIRQALQTCPPSEK